MPKLRENVKSVFDKPSEIPTPDVPVEEPREVSQGSSREYSERSPIRKAYEAGQMPVDHKKLLEGIKHELGDGASEGIIQLEKVLETTGYHRASALKMLHHMQNFGVLETKPQYRATWVKLLK